MSNFIISDLHFGHNNILKFSHPYRSGNDTKEHDDWLVSQYNSVVGKGDHTYILGDIAFNKNSFINLLKLNGSKTLVLGNHDTWNVIDYLPYFKDIKGLIKFKNTFWLSHAPIHPHELRGLKNIHGHVHQNSIQDSRYINACVESCGGKPVNLDDLVTLHKRQ